MAWNEPGGNGKDPWSGKGRNQDPPDLDEVVKKLQDKLAGVFGSGKSSGGGTTPLKGGSIGLGAVALIALVVWLLSGIYIVQPAERGVVLRFGAFSEVTQPGPHWHIPVPIEDVLKVDVDEITSFRHKAQMLTRDENIVDIELTVQSRIQDAVDFLFQDQDPRKTIKDATETAVREIVGKSELDAVLTEGRSTTANRIKEQAQGLVNDYKTGLIITSINMDAVKPPEQVKSAFDDAIKAREDKEKLENQAEAYFNEVVPQARGEAARQIADAKAYRERVISEARGDVSRFLAVLNVYKSAPVVTRERLYLDALETMFGQSSKVMMDTEGGGDSLMYLPLDKLMQSSKPEQQTQTDVSSSQGGNANKSVRLRETSRSSRRTR